MYSEIYIRFMKKILLLCSLISAVSCSKINQKKQFFGEWLILKKEQKNTDNSLTDITKPCELDDSEAYRNMGVWYYNPGNIKCTESELPTTGQWNYDASSKRIVYTSSVGINVSEAYVERIDGDTMILNLHVANNPNTTRITYKKVK